MDNGRISVRYARALFQLAHEQGCEDAVYGGLTRFARNYFLAITQFNEVLADPMVAREEKVKLVEMAVGEPLHDTLKRFIAFVADKKREDTSPRRRSCRTKVTTTSRPSSSRPSVPRPRWK